MPKVTLIPICFNTLTARPHPANVNSMSLSRAGMEHAVKVLTKLLVESNTINKNAKIM